MGAAWLLSQQHNVTLFEAERRLGGHARTLDVDLGDGEFAVDTGFIVFNRVNYPHLCGLFAELDIATRKSDMSFAVSMDKGRIEYGCRNLASMLSQSSNGIRPAFWRMIWDIDRFNRNSRQVCAAEPELTVEELINRLSLGDWFEKYFLLPISGAIWSAPRVAMRDYPAAHLVRFFDRHGLLSMTGQHQWWTVQEGSRRYVEKMASRIGANLLMDCPVKSVTRRKNGVSIIADKATDQPYRSRGSCLSFRHCARSACRLRLPRTSGARAFALSKQSRLSAHRYRPNAAATDLLVKLGLSRVFAGR